MDSSTKERRDAPRRRVLKAGIIAFNERRSTLQCVVRDVSRTGARVRVEGAVIAPDKFVVIIELDGFEADCEVESRRNRDLGVKFMSMPRAVKPKRVQIVKALTRQAPD